MSDDHLPPLVLIGNQGRNIGFYTTSSKTDNDDRGDKTSEPRAMIKSGGNGGASQDEKSEHVDEAEDDDGVVLSEVLIGDD